MLNEGVGGLSNKSIALAHQIGTIAKERLITQLGTVTDEKLRQSINAALKVHLNL
jgi:mRNA-degrading endonuclease toxin of MazEF toxin-antitoxin module